MFFDIHNPEFWVAVAFCGFLALLAWFKVPAALGRALDQRAVAIRKELDEARKLREQAQELLDEYTRKQRLADDEAQAIVANAEREAAAMKVAAEKSLKESLERRARLAEEKIGRAEQQAVAEVRAAAIDAAVVAAERILKAKVGTTAAGAPLVDQAIRDLKGRLN
ncbi:MAG TPA: F0F1 ATP synthase subunit B [Hyphomicrobiaceae bacterium]|nr:F0F1 ATP synthase subunit B [Hyphomicrobiaceae bacterium]